MSQPALHQFTESISFGDATSDHVFLLRKWLRELGFESNIYAEHFVDDLGGKVLPASSYRRTSDQKHVIYHHATGADVVDRLLAIGLPIVLIYHNITPPEFFAQSNPSLINMLMRGREQLVEMAPKTAIALGMSAYNEQELLETGFKHTAVVPIVLDPVDYAIPIDATLATKIEQQGDNLLFVGRIVPNKRQEDLVKLLAYLRRIRPKVHLTLLGSAHFRNYDRWLREFIAGEGLDDAVTITGHVSQAEMITYYRSSDLLVCMSEHEGFGKSLIESMYFDLPIMAYDSSAVPMTLGGSGIVFHEKNFEALAEIAAMILEDQTLRQSLIAGQRQRLQSFLEPNVRKEFIDILRQLGYAV